MALHPNGRNLLRSPGRHFGPAVGLELLGRGRGDRFNAFVSAERSRFAAAPYGYGMQALVPPLSAGGLSGASALLTTLSGSGNLGVAAEGLAGIALTLAGIGQLVSSASGSASLTLLASGNLFASKAADGTASFAFSMAGNVQASGYVLGTALVSIQPAGTLRATGNVSGSTAGGGSLTNESIAGAVWSASAALNNIAGTMGNKLNSAASGGVDYSALAGAVRTELQAELLRIIEIAKLHGLVVGADLVVTPGSRTAGDVTQLISEVGSTVTVSRQP